VVKWLAIGVVGVLVLGFVGSFVYTRFIADDAPERLDTTPTLEASADPDVTLPGTWVVAEGSQVGYRVKEILFGQSSEAVGRTEEITGSFTIDGDSLTEGSFEVDMASVTSDQSRRDGQFRGRIMEVDTYPTATFELTAESERHQRGADAGRVDRYRQPHRPRRDQGGDLRHQGRPQRAADPDHGVHPDRVCRLQHRQPQRGPGTDRG
jgi:hypothetical protein